MTVVLKKRIVIEVGIHAPSEDSGRAALKALHVRAEKTVQVGLNLERKHGIDGTIDASYIEPTKL